MSQLTRAKEARFGKLVEGKTPASGEALRVFVPSIEDIASRLKQLAGKKCEVHSPTYPRIL